MTENRIEFCGLPLDPLTLEDSAKRCLELIRERGHHHVVLNASKIVLAQDDAELRKIISSCGLVNADGQSVVWATRLLGQRIPERVTGIDLMNLLIDLAPSQGLSVYLLGAEQDVIEATSESFKSRGVNVLAHRNGFWASEDEQAVVAEIASFAPDLLLVAMPSPRKEKFISKWLPDLNVGLAFGVGGSFDVVAGKTRRAPSWIQRIGLEWFYRFLQEPGRLFKRYLVGNSRFIFCVASAKVSRSKK